ncbi:MAG: 2Fe-2S iron-sulfur cluster-binding protein [Burkholderiaceae bacterium]|jgi:ferredoxin
MADIPFFTGHIEDATCGSAVTFDAWKHQPLLASMEGGGIDWPSSCRNGTCRTCLSQVTEGRVQHTTEWPGVSSDELADGLILPCVAVPLSDVRIRRVE